MLVAGIDRNKASDSEKYVEKVVSVSGSFPISRSEKQADFRKHLQKRKGIILRNGDKRNQERRHGPKKPVKQQVVRDRRQINNREPHPKWNSQTHEIIVIALEKDPSDKKKWNVGEEVFVDTVSGQQDLGLESPPSSVQRSEYPPDSSHSSLVDDGEDYVVHLSRSYDKKS
ncbi:MAG: hypothetical protein ACE5E9_04755 [Nitrospinaceae bacterium]